MRLIDADKLIDFIDPGHLRQPDKLCFSEIDVVNMINHTPTAYDVDEVLRQLDEEKKLSYADLDACAELGPLQEPEERDDFVIGLKKAIKIIKCESESLPRGNVKDLISKEQLINKLNSAGINIKIDLPVEEILGENVDLDDFAALMQDAIQAYRKMVIDTIKNMSAEFSWDKATKQLSAVPTGTYTDTYLRKTARSEAIGYHKRLENKYLEAVETNDLESAAEILNKLKV